MLFRPESSARISPSPSRVISPRTIGPKEGGRGDAGFLEGAARGFSLRSSVVSVISPITTIDIQLSSQEMDLCNIILMEVVFPGDIGLTETVNI